MSLEIDPATGYLPAGIHQVPWSLLADLFCGNLRRQSLSAGLLEALTVLSVAGCQSVIIDGSFISAKPLPRDYDGAWEPQGVDPHLLDPVLLDFSNGRAAMKAKYGGELFPATVTAATGVLYRDFFKTDRNGVAKGVLLIDLGSLP